MIDAAEWVMAHRWAILPEMLKTIVAIARREMSMGDAKQAITTKDGQPLDGARRTEVRDGIAIIPVIGPIFPRANLFTAFSGGTSIQMLAKDFTTAMEDPSVKGIVLNVDSPGGEVTGVSEFSEMIYNARGKKPVDAYVLGLGASAGYWIVSGARRIILSNTGEVGSIGVVSAWVDESKADERKGVQVIEIVSSVSPDKRLTPTTDAGRAKIQKTVDDLATVFVDTVARNRGIDSETVIKDFGQGWVKVGQDALDSGMVDEIGNLEQVIADLQTESNQENNSFFSFTKGGASMKAEDIKTKYPDAYQAIFGEGQVAGIESGKAEGFEAGKKEGFSNGLETGKAQGAEEERARIQSIETLRVPGAEKIIAENKFKPGISKADVAILVCEQQSTISNGAAAAIQADAIALTTQAEGIGGGEPVTQTADDFAAAAKRAGERRRKEKSV